MAFGLAIETSSRVGELALVRHGAIVESRTFAPGLHNAAHLIPMLDALCRDHGCAPGNIGTLFVSIGPGSFTGIRIAVTLAKTLAFATGTKLVTVPTMRVLAENAPDTEAHLLVVLDARRGRIFSAGFSRRGGRWIEREPARLDRLADAIPRSPRPLMLLGEGLSYHSAAIPADSDIHIADSSLWRPRAAAVALLGEEMAGRGEFTDPYALSPLYLRLPEAEEKRLEQIAQLPSEQT